jgi:hypothetical protein
MKRLPGALELPQLTPSQPRFLRGLEEFGRGLPAEFADDLLIAFVSISETLITSILRRVPRDPRVVSAVRNTVRDHCIDEARHHFEGPAAVADWAARGYPLRLFHLHRDPTLPSLADFDMLTVMGGPMSANDEARLSWLGPEIALIREAIAADKTVLGICLGAQIIAKPWARESIPGAPKK